MIFSNINELACLEDEEDRVHHSHVSHHKETNALYNNVTIYLQHSYTKSNALIGRSTKRVPI